MSNAEQLLKQASSVASTPSPPPRLSKADATSLNGDRRSNTSNSQATISLVVQEVLRNICHGEEHPCKESATNGVVSAHENGIDACVSSVVQSISNDRRALTNNVPSVNTEQILDADLLEPPPKLFAINDEHPNLDQYRYRKRRKRRFFTGRRPTRRCPIKLTPETDVVINGTKPVVRKRQRTTRLRAKSEETPMKIEKRKISPVDAQIHDSVFAPDRCRLSKMSKRRENHFHETSVSNSLCWHSCLNEKLLPHVRDFVHADLSGASTWTAQVVSDFVRALPGCPPTVADSFRDEQIDGEAFLLLTQDDIIKLMNIRLGPAVKIHNAIMLLKHQKMISTKND